MWVEVWEDVRRCEDEKMWEDVKMRRCEYVKMRRCEDEKVWRWEDVRMRRCEDEKMWRWEDVKMRRCEDEKMWRWEDVKMRRWGMRRRCEDKKMWRWEDVKMRRCEDEKMFYRPPLLEEPCAQTLSGKTKNKKKQKPKNHRVRRFYGVRRSCRVRGFYSMCTSLAVECDALAGVRRICGMRRIPSMRGWYRDHIGKFRGQNQNSNPKASPNFPGAHQWVLFFRVHLGWGPGEETC